MQYMLDALASLGPQAVPRLIAALQYETLRAHVAHILGQIGPPAAPAVPALVKVLADPDPNVRTAAEFALGKIGPGAKEAVPALVQLVKEPEKSSAHAAVYALGSIGPDAAAAEPALVELIDGLDNSLSLISAWALIQIRGATADTANKVMPELLAGLKSSLPQSRATAAEALGSLGKLAAGAAPQLERAAKDPNEQVREAATKALASIRG